MEDEFNLHLKNKTFKLTELPSGRTAIPSKWVYKIKEDSSGKPTRYKSCVVTQGFRQIEGLDYTDTFAPVATLAAVRLFFAICAYLGWTIFSADVATAYLNGYVDEEIYMTQIPGFEVPGREGLVCRLLKGIPGLKQAGRVWNTALNKALSALGLSKCENAECVYTLRRKGVSVAMLVLWVDDLLIGSKSPKLTQELFAQLKKTYDLTVQGSATDFIGWKVQQDKDAGTISLSQPGLCLKVLKVFRMENCKPAVTPMESTVKLTSTLDHLGSAEQRPLGEEEATLYRSGLGSLMYLVNSTRPDLATATVICARFMQKPLHGHMTALKQILRYVRGTVNLGIEYC
jgi:hypothetical protein